MDMLTSEWKPAKVLCWGHKFAYISTENKELSSKPIKIRIEQK